MNVTTNKDWNRRELTVPSDNLKSLFNLCDMHPVFAEVLGMIPRIRLVIDTNIVLQELLFMTKARRLPSARTALREVMDCGIVVTIAPLKLSEEVNRHIPRLAEAEHVPVEKLLFAWFEFQTRIEFHQTEQFAKFEGPIVDPDDVEFVTLYLNSDVDAVLTHDKDISRMGAETLNLADLTRVRDYARAKSPEVTLRVGGILITGVASGGFVALLKLVAAALRAFSKLSPDVQICLVLGAVLAALHPATRKTFRAGVSAIADTLKGPAAVFGEVFAEVSLQMGMTQLELKEKQLPIDSIRRRISADKVLTADSLPTAQSPVQTAFGVRIPLHSSAVKVAHSGKRARKSSTARKGRHVLAVAAEADDNLKKVPTPPGSVGKKHPGTGKRLTEEPVSL